MNTNSWHLSKSVPISFILAIVAQTVALVWYVSSLDNNIKNNQRELIRHETRIEAIEKVVQSQAVTLGRMDENIKAIRHSVEKMANRDTEQ
jgi:septal ring factor EnvC (AmiA/AmiB activator)